MWTKLRDGLRDRMTIAIAAVLLTMFLSWVGGLWDLFLVNRQFFTNAAGAVVMPFTLEKLGLLMSEIPKIHEEVRSFREETQSLTKIMQTQVGDCVIFQTLERRTALVYRRSPYKRDQQIRVENLSSNDRASVIATVGGDFDGDGKILVKLSPDAGAVLGIRSTDKVRVEVSPVNSR